VRRKQPLLTTGLKPASLYALSRNRRLPCVIVRTQNRQQTLAHQAEDRLNLEQERVTNYLHSSTEEKLLKVSQTGFSVSSGP
jgi:hypothetical protein